MITIKQADLLDLEDVVPLFDLYRMFYDQPSNQEAATEFLKDRITKQESVIFIAYEKAIPVGFTQLYQTFSSVSLKPYLILNDLFVLKNHRQKKVGSQLLESAKKYCREKGQKGLALETAIDNPAQKLYEKLEWKKDSHCFHYFWTA
ncbi:GNAT family N-acetyltransferase [Maribacter sp. MJ134]|uniref:GNAT family N-acetyltransferase n=1 Tax=Maribacter sp. MJ134 TaxID=2496865 RepID=UPI000F8418DE|nr:GNAT family N-acetyltransferase [Maribacter sp. MJ134]AZQ57945.1 GNAT family N-acetyltransferase [Maribacter sp. MJ134]